MPELPSHKKCSTCKQPKAFEEFYKNKSQRYGLASECKQCKNAAAKLYAHTARRKQINKDGRRRYYYRNKIKCYARMLVKAKVKRGTMKRSETCQQCGIAAKTEAHHHKGYAVENRFDVIWLCFACHREIEKV